jgi:hypothetical protein
MRASAHPLTELAMPSTLFTSACASLVLYCIAHFGAPQDQREPIAPAQPKFDLQATHIDWVEGLDKALGRDKPILLFQLLGRFDDVFC